MVKESAVLAMKKDNKFCFLKEQFENNKNIENIIQKDIKLILCNFKLYENYYLLKPVNHSLAKPVWLDIGSFPSKVFLYENQLFPLRKNDIIRLGLKELTVK